MVVILDSIYGVAKFAYSDKNGVIADVSKFAGSNHVVTRLGITQYNAQCA
jgi:hypothetical protein